MAGRTNNSRRRIDALRANLRWCRMLLASVVDVSDTQQLVRTADEAADALRVRPATVYRLVSEGDVPAHRVD